MRWRLPARARYLALASLAALLAGVFVHVYLGGLARRVPVVVAARDFAAYTVLDADIVRTVFLPPAAAHPASIARPADAVGRVSLVPRASGEQILSASLVSGENPGEYRASLAPEERALFLPASGVLGAWLGVRPGDFVDLTAVFDRGSRCLGQGLEVLDVVTDTAGTVLGGRAETPAGVFLRVTPAVAEQLSLAVEYGKVYVSVNGYGAVPVPTSGAWLEQLNEGGGGADEGVWP